MMLLINRSEGGRKREREGGMDGGREGERERVKIREGVLEGGKEGCHRYSGIFYTLN